MATRFARTSNSSTTWSPNTPTSSWRISRSRAGTGWCTGCEPRLLLLAGLITSVYCYSVRTVPDGHELGHGSTVGEGDGVVYDYIPPGLRFKRSCQLSNLEQVLGLVGPAHRREFRAAHEVEPQHRRAGGKKSGQRPSQPALQEPHRHHGPHDSGQLAGRSS